MKKSGLKSIVVIYRRGENMDKVTVKDLRKQAKDLGIKNYTGFRKAELFELVQNASRDTTVVEPKKGRPVVDEPPQKRWGGSFRSQHREIVLPLWIT